MGIPPEHIRGSLRLTLGRTTTADETARAAELVASCVARVRGAAAGGPEPAEAGVTAEA
jgi:cysteine sulfinate desulfinase/cysteine desulfurase-like protein